jgi:hypothetical protein
MRLLAVPTQTARAEHRSREPSGARDRKPADKSDGPRSSSGGHRCSVIATGYLPFLSFLSFFLSAMCSPCGGSRLGQCRPVQLLFPTTRNGADHGPAAAHDAFAELPRRAAPDSIRPAAGRPTRRSRRPSRMPAPRTRSAARACFSGPKNSCCPVSIPNVVDRRLPCSTSRKARSLVP